VFAFFLLRDWFCSPFGDARGAASWDKKSLIGVRDTHQARLTSWQKDAK
jgi:hypothetical protein